MNSRASSIARGAGLVGPGPGGCGAGGLENSHNSTEIAGGCSDSARVVSTDEKTGGCCCCFLNQPKNCYCYNNPHKF